MKFMRYSICAVLLFAMIALETAPQGKLGVKSKTEKSTKKEAMLSKVTKRRLMEIFGGLVAFGGLVGAAYGLSYLYNSYMNPKDNKDLNIANKEVKQDVVALKTPNQKQVNTNANVEGETNADDKEQEENRQQGQIIQAGNKTIEKSDNGVNTGSDENKEQVKKTESSENVENKALTDEESEKASEEEKDNNEKKDNNNDEQTK